MEGTLISLALRQAHTWTQLCTYQCQAPPTQVRIGGDLQMLDDKFPEVSRPWGQLPYCGSPTNYPGNHISMEKYPYPGDKFG